MASEISKQGGTDRALQTNLRPLYILNTIASAAAPMSAAELVKVLDVPKPTIHRLLQTLEDDGWLMRDLTGRGYVGGHRLRRMAANTFSGPGLRRERIGILQRLADSVGETCNIAMPEGEAMIYIDRVETHWPLQIRLPIGSKVPLHCTASGKSYLSTLPQQQFNRLLSRLDLIARTPYSIIDPGKLSEEVKVTRDRGYAVDSQELLEGMIALAVPVRDDLGRAFGTVSFHAPSQRLTIEAAIAYLPSLQRTAVELGETITTPC